MRGIGSGKLREVRLVARQTRGSEVLFGLLDVVVTVVVDRGDHVQHGAGEVAYGVPETGADEHRLELFPLTSRSKFHDLMLGVFIPDVHESQPRNHVHDFVFGSGAVGVRTTPFFVYDGVDAREELGDFQVRREAGTFDYYGVGIDGQFDQVSATYEQLFDDTYGRGLDERCGRCHNRTSVLCCAVLDSDGLESGDVVSVKVETMLVKVICGMVDDQVFVSVERSRDAEDASFRKGDSLPDHGRNVECRKRFSVRSRWGQPNVVAKSFPVPKMNVSSSSNADHDFSIVSSTIRVWCQMISVELKFLALELTGEISADFVRQLVEVQTCIKFVDRQLQNEDFVVKESVLDFDLGHGCLQGF